MMRRFFSSFPGRSTSLASAFLFLLAVSGSALAQGSGKYGYCYSNYPGGPGYVVSQPTYMSGVLQYPGDSYDGSGFTAYVKQQYGVATAAGCSYGMPLRDAQLYITRDAAKFRSTGPGNRTVVQTGWVLSGAAAAAPSPAAAPSSGYAPRGAGPAPSASAPAAAKTVVTFCTVAAGSRNYVSAVMPAAGDPQGHVVNDAFRSYLKQKYNPAGAIPLPSCGTYDSLAYANQMFHQWVITEGAKLVQTGWTYSGPAASSTVAAASTPSTASTAYPAAAVTPAPPPPPAEGTITVRLVEPINSFTDPPGKHYRAVVTQAVTIGKVNIPVDTLSTVTVSGSAGNLSAHLDTLSPNGQQPLNVTTSAVTPVTAGSNAAMSAAAAGAKQVQSIMSIGGFGRKPATPPKAVSVMAQGDKVVLPPGTTLSFTTSVPQNSASTSSSAQAATPAQTPSNGLTF